MAKRLVDVPLGKFGNNGFANLRRTCCTVFCQRCMDDMLHALAYAPTKLACPAEQCALLYQQPRAIAHPVTPVVLCCCWLLAGGFQSLEGLRQVIPELLGWELQWEVLAFPPVCRQLPLPCADGCNDNSVIQVVVLWPSKLNVPKLPCVSPTCKNVVWLQVMRSPLPLVPSGPPCLCQLFAWSTGCELL